MKVRVVTADGQLDAPEAPNGNSEAYKFLDFLVGPGWVMHRLNDELAVASLLKHDEPSARNLHAEVLVASIGVPESRQPRLYGDVVFLHWEVPLLSRKPKIRSLSERHDTQITEAFAVMEQVGA